MMTRCAGLINGRVPMVMGTGAIRTEDSIMYAKAAKAAGADALLVATPPYAYPTGREIALHALGRGSRCEPACDAVQLPRPDVGRHGRGVSGPLGPLAQLLWNQGKFWRYQPIAHAGGATTRISPCPAAWMIKRWNSSRGVRVLGSAQVQNFAPEAHIALYEACVLEGDFKKGRAIMSAMLPLNARPRTGWKICAVHQIRADITRH